MPIKFGNLSISTFHTDCHKLPVFLNMFLEILHYGVPIIQRGGKKTEKNKDKEVFR